ncbi:X-linked retinitis pigmentosa GTPase regulator-interacting protein 1 [Boleophthalmus pectinirostris]|uniref:X-linked retinitis pigmentosa GTPase regulator-interacting protein 1 n=1 Tax=Boleophthalmus pectinirostris TaxID=150288 RepID=UPI00242A95E2|nr:X-linked retinitis pigmentosa GTPase regulator-interacting protein 1 [Boleophthalmus pectinirostris]
MSPVVDETAGDVPVRDVGLRGGLMPAVPDSVRDPKATRRHHHSRTKMDPQRVFRAPRDQLEELCLRLQEENSVLKQHSRSQEQRIKRMSTRLSRARQTRPSSSGARERDLEETIQELEARVALLEGQKQLLHNRLSLAKQHLLELGGPTLRYGKVRSFDGEGGARRATHTAPARYGPALDHSDRLGSSGAEQLRIAQLELTAQTLRDTLRDRDRDRELQDMRRTQALTHRETIRENVELVRMQKQLTDKSTALRLTEERLALLQEAFEKQLQESQRSLEDSQGSLLLQLEELRGQLKDERQKTVELDGQLSSASVSQQTINKLQERVSDLEGERDLIKQNYDSLLQRTFSGPHKALEQSHREKREESNQQHSSELLLLRDALQREREKVCGLEEDMDTMRQEVQQLQEDKHRRTEQEKQMVGDTGETQKLLEQQIVHYKEQVSTLQHRLDSVAQAFEMNVDELSETLFQIKEFRAQQESRAQLGFLRSEGPLEQIPLEMSQVQASHAETVLELQKTRELLRLEHNICKDLQGELKLLEQRMDREREESRRRSREKDQLLSKRSLQISTLQAQLKELAYSPRNYKRTLPLQYTWPGVDLETVQPLEDDLVFAQLKPGESLLEVHLQSVTFTPWGLRALGALAPQPQEEGPLEDVVTFCTYSLLDFELHSTPLVSGSQPSYGFTSRYVLTPRDLERLRGSGGGAPLELHQAVGGVRFVTHGGGRVSLQGALQRRGERVEGRVNITGPEGGAVGVLDFWARLHTPAEPVDSGPRRTYGRPSQKVPEQVTLGWQEISTEEVLDLDVGVPNELLVILERCVGLSSRWPGVLPDAYLSYRLYDLPPHASPTVPCSADPVYNHSTCYPLAVTQDLLSYLRCSSLWVYVFDDSEDQVPPVYLAKTPVPLRALTLGRDIRGDYVLRDAAGGPRGVVRVQIKWKYPFKAPSEEPKDRRPEQEEERRRVESISAHKPIAKPRVKVTPPTTHSGLLCVIPSPPLKQRSAPQLVVPVETPRERKRSSRMGPGLEPTPHSRRSPSSSPSRGRSARTSRRDTPPAPSPSPPPQDQAYVEQDSGAEHRDHPDTAEEPVSSVVSECSSTHSDEVVVPPARRLHQGPRLRVEILSLCLEPCAPVALDRSVQRLFVEYRLLGVPLHSTETPMSLRKPSRGEEVHYNFSRVIYVDGTHAAPLRHYLFTMLEGTDPHQGRLKFTVVSEPMDEEDECVDVGHAFLDLRALLETGEDVLERDIQIVAIDEDKEDKEVIGHLKVSLEAAVALSGIYREFHQHTEEDKENRDREDRKDRDKESLKVTEFDQDNRLDLLFLDPDVVGMSTQLQMWRGREHVLLTDTLYKLVASFCGSLEDTGREKSIGASSVSWLPGDGSGSVDYTCPISATLLQSVEASSRAAGFAASGPWR